MQISISASGIPKVVNEAVRVQSKSLRTQYPGSTSLVSSVCDEIYRHTAKVPEDATLSLSVSFSVNVTVTPAPAVEKKAVAPDAVVVSK